MSATRDLIAAALTAADLMDETIPYFHVTEELRELCARAMVQPDMGEVKNLVSAACNLMFDAGKLLGRRDAGADREVEDARSARTALLDYVRGVMAERDALIAAHAGATKKMARDERQLFESWIVRECGPGETKRWLNTEVYENMRVNDYRTGWVACLGLMSATTQPISAAEVPMPKPNYDGYDLIDRFLRNNLDDDDYDEYMSGLHQYGDTREAAGYARGLAAGGKDAERYQHAKLHGWPEYRCEIHPNPNGVPQWGYCGYWFDSPDAAIDAALRGEVKP